MVDPGDSDGGINAWEPVHRPLAQDGVCRVGGQGTKIKFYEEESHGLNASDGQPEQLMGVDAKDTRDLDESRMRDAPVTQLPVQQSGHGNFEGEQFSKLRPG